MKGKYLSRVTKCSLLLNLLLLLTACSDAQDDPSNSEITDPIIPISEEQKIPSYEEFKNSLPITPNGQFVVEKDIQVSSEIVLQEYYTNIVLSYEDIINSKNSNTGKAIVNTDPFGNITVWEAQEAVNLTYCVAYDPLGIYGEGFEFFHWSDVSNALRIAATEWESHANVNFIYLPQHDTNCTADNANVTFRVRPVSGENWIASAFFPNSQPALRTLYFNTDYIPGFVGQTYVDNLFPISMAGILRHELGHILGLRHEHIRPAAFNFFCGAEDFQWEVLTPYDALSVMHYPQCDDNIIEHDLTISSLDIEGILQLYPFTDSDSDGMPDTWELRYGLNPLLDDSLEDLDNDSLTNLQEFQLGTDPTVADNIRASTWTVPNVWGGGGYTWSGDFNGDGLTDIASAKGGNIYMKLSTGTSFATATWTVPNQWGGAGYTWTGDFNGDGLTDIASAKGGNIYMKLSTGSGFSTATWTVPNQWGGSGYTWSGDFNADGLTDIASAKGGNIYMKLSTGTSFATATWTVPNQWGGSGYTWIGDFNADGLSDIASAKGGNIYMKLSTGTSFTTATWTVPNQWGGSGFTWASDFNGDGLTDIASANRGNIYMKLSTGTSFTTATWTVPNHWGGSGFTWASDFNGDGLTDIASANGGDIYMKLSTGSNFTTSSWAVPNQWGGSRFTWVADFNGDGASDIASAKGGNIFMKISVGVATDP